MIDFSVNLMVIRKCYMKNIFCILYYYCIAVVKIYVESKLLEFEGKGSLLHVKHLLYNENL